jgi:hypothetical protein
VKFKQICKDYYIKEKGVWGKFKDMKTSTAKLLDKLEYICDLYEKTKNFITWVDKYLSIYFLLLLITIFILVTYLPMRTILMVWIVYRFT